MSNPRPERESGAVISYSIGWDRDALHELAELLGAQSPEQIQEVINAFEGPDYLGRMRTEFDRARPSRNRARDNLRRISQLAREFVQAVHDDCGYEVFEDGGFHGWTSEAWFLVNDIVDDGAKDMGAALNDVCQKLEAVATELTDERISAHLEERPSLYAPTHAEPAHHARFVARECAVQFAARNPEWNGGNNRRLRELVSVAFRALRIEGNAEHYAKTGAAQLRAERGEQAL